MLIYVPAQPFGGREPVARCETCGQYLARLSLCEWVDAIDNKASDWPEWHEHKPRTEQEVTSDA